MSKQQVAKQERTQRRSTRTRSRMQGTAERPRVSVQTSLASMFVQFIDDTQGTTILSARDTEKTGTKTERATKLGEVLAQKAQAAGITHIIFDRGPKQYHGRVKALAESLRSGGLTF